VVVGAGPVGSRRARTLADAGAEVVVVAPHTDPALDELVASGRVELVRRTFDPGDVAGAVLVVAATGSSEVDRAVEVAAHEAGALLNAAGDSSRSDLAFPATVRRGPVTFAVSTGGRSPSTARWLAALLDERLGELIELGPHGYGVLVEVVEAVRGELAAASGRSGATGATPGAVDWRRALDGSILDLIDQGRPAEAKERLLACLSSS